MYCNEDENYIFVSKFAKIVLIIRVTNTWPERGASTVKRVKIRNEDYLEKWVFKLAPPQIIGPTSHNNEAKVVVAEVVKKYDLSRRHHRLNKSCVVIPITPVVLQCDLAEQD